MKADARRENEKLERQLKEEWVDLMMEYLKKDEWLYQRVNTVYNSTFSILKPAACFAASKLFAIVL